MYDLLFHCTVEVKASVTIFPLSFCRFVLRYASSWSKQCYYNFVFLHNLHIDFNLSMTYWLPFPFLFIILDFLWCRLCNYSLYFMFFFYCSYFLCLYNVCSAVCCILLLYYQFRVAADGLGTKVNDEGITFYNNIINALLEKGMKPILLDYCP